MESEIHWELPCNPSDYQGFHLFAAQYYILSHEAVMLVNDTSSRHAITLLDAYCVACTEALCLCGIDWSLGSVMFEDFKCFFSIRRNEL